MAERDLTFRELADRTRKADKRGKGLTHGYLAAIVGERERPPSIPATGLIARALKVKPEHFVEWRLWEVRSRFDPDEVGFERALRNLDDYNDEQAGDGSDEPPLPRGGGPGGTVFGNLKDREL